MELQSIPLSLVRAPISPKFAAGTFMALALLSSACGDAAANMSGPDASKQRVSSDRPTTAVVAAFSILGNSAVTCTDGTIAGDAGTFKATPTGSITRNRCPMTGTAHVGDNAARDAYNQQLRNFTALAPKAGDICTTLTGTLAGMTLAPGAYCFTVGATVTGLLTLKGPANGTWVFKIGTSGIGALTGTNFSVVMAGGGQARNVSWRVANGFTMTTSTFQGNILAGAGVTLTGGTFTGNAWSMADVTITRTAVKPAL